MNEKSMTSARKSMMEKMEKEVHKLENDLKNSGDANKKIKLLRSLKISLRFGQLIAPYVLTAGITFGAFAALGEVPFYKNYHKKRLETQMTLDSFGNVRYEQQYDSFENRDTIITSYGKWKNESDKFYSRLVKTYELRKVDESVITQLINDNNEDALERLFLEPVSLIIEKQNNLTEEEINKDAYLEARIYSKSEDDFIIVRESLKESLLIGFGWILFTLIPEFITLYLREEHSSFDFNECIDKIKEKYPFIKTDELSKQLEIRKANYDRLKR